MRPIVASVLQIQPITCPCSHLVGHIVDTLCRLAILALSMRIGRTAVCDRGARHGTVRV
jgi:hypothetical protein